MRKPVLCPPVTTVNIQEDRVRALARRDPQFDELIGIRSIRQALVGLWLRVAEDVFAEHDFPAPRVIPASV